MNDDINNDDISNDDINNDNKMVNDHNGADDGVDNGIDDITSIINMPHTLHSPAMCFQGVPFQSLYDDHDLPNKILSICFSGVSPVRGMPLTFVLEPDTAGLIVISFSLMVMTACCF